MGEITSGRVIMGTDEAEPILGVTCIGVCRYYYRSGESYIEKASGNPTEEIGRLYSSHNGFRIKSEIKLFEYDCN